MVQEARQGVVVYYNTDEQLQAFFQRLVDLVRADQREIDAKVADGFIGGDVIAERIRNRGNT
jgi:DICT domain-containing protein